MSEVKRYRLAYREGGGSNLEEWPNGELVNASDFDTVMNRANCALAAAKSAEANYDAETARADRAEAGCAALVERLEKMAIAGLDAKAKGQLYLIYDTLQQPHPGSRFLELAKLVDGLNADTGRFTDIEEAMQMAGYVDIGRHLARLLAYRSTHD